MQQVTVVETRYISVVLSIGVLPSVLKMSKDVSI